MKLYFLRHGIAADRASWVGRDADRPLTTEGRQRVDGVAKTVARLELNIGRLLTSPSLRARQTAEIVARKLDIVDLLEIESRLAPGFDIEKLAAILHARSSESALLLVGHEPDFADTVSELIGGGRMKCKKAGLARVDVTLTEPISGELVWLVPPKLLAGLHGSPG